MASAGGIGGGSSPGTGAGTGGGDDRSAAAAAAAADRERQLEFVVDDWRRRNQGAEPSAEDRQILERTLDAMAAVHSAQHNGALPDDSTIREWFGIAPTVAPAATPQPARRPDENQRGLPSVAVATAAAQQASTDRRKAESVVLEALEKERNRPKTPREIMAEALEKERNQPTKYRWLEARAAERRAAGAKALRGPAPPAGENRPKTPREIMAAAQAEYNRTRLRKLGKRVVRSAAEVAAVRRGLEAAHKKRQQEEKEKPILPKDKEERRKDLACQALLVVAALVYSLYFGGT